MPTLHAFLLPQQSYTISDNIHRAHNSTPFHYSSIPTASVNSSLTHQQRHHHRHSCHLNTFIICFSSFLSLLLLLITVSGRLSSYYMAVRKSSSASVSSFPASFAGCRGSSITSISSTSTGASGFGSVIPFYHDNSCYIISNMLIPLILIQVIFVSGEPFKGPVTMMARAGEGDSETSEKRCKYVGMLLHYFHLVASFWMLSNSLDMYLRLWTPSDDCERLISRHFSEDDLYLSQSAADPCGNLSSSSCDRHNGNRNEPPKRFGRMLTLTAFSWLVPLLCVIVSNLLNPAGYETHRL